MRSRLRDRLDGLLAKKPLPIRQERQAAPQVRVLESRFVLDASAALVGLGALGSAWEAQSEAVQGDASVSTGVPAQEHLADSMALSTTWSAQSVNDAEQCAGTGTGPDILGLDLDLTHLLWGGLSI